MSNDGHLPAGVAKGELLAALDKVVSGSEHLKIQYAGKEPVCVISAEDYRSFRYLLEAAADRLDLQEAETRITSSDRDSVDFDEFFTELEKWTDPVLN